MRWCLLVALACCCVWVAAQPLPPIPSNATSVTLAPGTYTLDHTLQLANRSLTITCPSGMATIRPSTLAFSLYNISLTMVNIAFEDSPAGVLDGSFARLDLRGCRFANNKAPRGAAIRLSDPPSVSFSQCTFDNNQATQDAGGALNLQFTGTLTSLPLVAMDACTFTTNSATTQGGAISIGGTAAVRMVDSTFVRNSVVGNTPTTGGGALHLNRFVGSPVTLQRVNFTQNWVRVQPVDANTLNIYGGAVFDQVFALPEDTHSPFVATDCIFQENSLELVFNQNVAMLRGGAVLHLQLNGKAAKLVYSYTRCTFEANTIDAGSLPGLAFGSAGALGLYSSSDLVDSLQLVVDGCLFRSNRVVVSGGMRSFFQLSSGSHGGAIGINFEGSNERNTHLHVQNSLFDHNQVSTGVGEKQSVFGGALYVSHRCALTYNATHHVVASNFTANTAYADQYATEAGAGALMIKYLTAFDSGIQVKYQVVDCATLIESTSFLTNRVRVPNVLNSALQGSGGAIAHWIGMIQVARNVSVTLRACTIKDNIVSLVSQDTTEAHGGAVSIESNAAFTTSHSVSILDSSLSNNTCASRSLQNAAMARGGAVSVRVLAKTAADSRFTLRGTQFHRNELYIESTFSSFQESVFCSDSVCLEQSEVRSRATDVVAYGGALSWAIHASIASNTVLNIHEASFVDNVLLAKALTSQLYTPAKAYGGAVSIQATTQENSTLEVDLAHVLLHHNVVDAQALSTTASYGGGLSLVTTVDEVQMDVDNVTACHNWVNATHSATSSAYGGGVYVSHNARVNNLAASDLTILDNYASATAFGSPAITLGAGMYLASRGASLSQHTFADSLVTGNVAAGNSSNSRGGGVYVTRSVESDSHTVDLFRNTTVRNNQAAGGAGVYHNAYRSSGTRLHIHNCTLDGNQANGDTGGGLRVQSESAAVGSEVHLEGSTLSRNSAASGGGVRLVGANLNADGCVFTGNTADAIASAIMSSAGNVTLTQVTLDRATGSDAVVWMEEDALLSMRSSRFVGGATTGSELVVTIDCPTPVLDDMQWDCAVGAPLRLENPSGDHIYTCHACAQDYYALLANSTVCHRCPTSSGVVCLGGNKVQARAGYQIMLDGSDNSVAALMCPQGMCCDANTCPWYDSCYVGRDPAVPFCGGCLPGRTEAFGTSACMLKSQCGDALSWSMFIGVIVLAALYIALQLVNPRKHGSGTFKSLLYFFQTSDMLVLETGKWSIVHGTVGRVINLQADGLSGARGACLWDMTSVEKLVWNGYLVVVVLFALLCVCWLVWLAVSRSERMRSVFRVAFWSVSLMAYSSITKTTLQLLNCRETVGGKSVVYHAGALECWKGGDGSGYQWLAVGLLPFVVAFPVWLWWVSYSSKELYLTGVYRSRYWWWESTLMFRRLVIILLHTFVRDSAWPWRAVLVFFACSFVVMSHHLSMPFRKYKDNMVEAFLLWVLLGLAGLNVLSSSYVLLGHSLDPSLGDATHLNGIEVLETVLMVAPVLLGLWGVIKVIWDRRAAWAAKRDESLFFATGALVTDNSGVGHSYKRLVNGHMEDVVDWEMDEDEQKSLEESLRT